jgi:hypothetical protein
MSTPTVTPALGAAPPGDAADRDAVHVAVKKMRAVRTMYPGEHLQNGIVDPFLKAPVRYGEWYWLLLYPNTVTTLRHVWEHPAFPNEPPLPPKGRSEADVWAERANDPVRPEVPLQPDTCEDHD